MFQHKRKWDALLYKSYLGKGRKPLVIEKPQIADFGKQQKNLPTWPIASGKKEKRRVAYLFLLPCIIAGKSAATQDQLFLGSPQLHSVVVALGICCGFVRLWGYASASQKKSQTKFRREKKKVQKQLIWLGKRFGIFPTYATIFFGISWFYDQKSYHIVFIIVVFSGLLVARRYSDSKQSGEQQGKDYFYLLESFPGHHEVTVPSSEYWRHTEIRYKKKVAIVLLDWESKKKKTFNTEQSKSYLNKPEC